MTFHIHDAECFTFKLDCIPALQHTKDQQDIVNKLTALLRDQEYVQPQQSVFVDSVISSKQNNVNRTDKVTVNFCSFRQSRSVTISDR